MRNYWTVTVDLHYYKEKRKFVVAPSQYDIIQGKTGKSSTELKRIV